MTGCRSDEIGGSNLDRRGSGEHEFDRIFTIHDTAHADDRDPDSPIDIPDHPQGNGFDGGTGQASCVIPQNGAACPAIDC